MNYSLFNASAKRMRFASLAGINPDSAAAANVMTSEPAIIAPGV